MLLRDAEKIYAGSQTVSAIYLGATKVWPAVGAWTPASLPGLAVWLDATQAGATAGYWENLGSGPDGEIVGTPLPTVNTNALNGLPVMRFKPSEGRVRIASTGVHLDWTLVYVGRLTGPTPGRVIDAYYPPNNLLVGFWNGNQDVMYDSGFASNTYAPWTTDWKLYSGDGSDTPRESRIFSDGTLLGSTTTAAGWGGTFNVSGYAVTEETCDCEVAEVVQYNRKLSDADRQRVEDYLRNKWFVPPVPPLDSATQAYLDASGLDSSYAPALDDLVIGLKDAGLWTKMKAVYPFIGGTADLHKWNLIDPRDTDDAYRLTYYGTQYSTHSEALGYRPNQAINDVPGGGHADTHFIPSSVLNQDNTHLSMYSLMNLPIGSRCDMGMYNWDGAGGRFHTICCYHGNAFYYGMSERGATSTPVPDSSGMFVATRTGASYQAAYRNGALKSSSDTPSYPLPHIPIYIGGLNNYDREYSDLPFGFASIGLGLSAQNVADLYTVVQAYQTALNRVITPTTMMPETPTLLPAHPLPGTRT